MFDSSVPYFVIASTGPIAAALEVVPPAIFEGGTFTMLGAVGLAIWRCANLATKSMESAEKHRQAQVKQWEADAAHRAAELAMWKG